MIEIYVDGSCRGNGQEENCGGWGLVALVEDERTSSGYRVLYYDSQQHENTTNNRMELIALIEALDLATTIWKHKTCIIKCDSAYCVNIFNSWIHSWASNNWKRAGNKEIENLDLVKQLYKYATIDFPNFQVLKVVGHAGILGNEIADAFAVNDKAKLAKIFKNNELDIDFIQKLDF